jgi:hypothetical protein
MTKLNRFALIPQFSQPGDVYCLSLGMVTPFVLRPVAVPKDDGGRCYHLVGEAYVHGIMGGELVDALESGGIEKNEITLM